MRKLYSLVELEQLFPGKFTVRTLRREIQAGRLKALRARPSVNAKLLVEEADFDAWMENAKDWAIQHRTMREED